MNYLGRQVQQYLPMSSPSDIKAVVRSGQVCRSWHKVLVFTLRAEAQRIQRELSREIKELAVDAEEEVRELEKLQDNLGRVPSRLNARAQIQFRHRLRLEQRMELVCEAFYAHTSTRKVQTEREEMEASKDKDALVELKTCYHENGRFCFTDAPPGARVAGEIITLVERWTAACRAKGMKSRPCAVCGNVSTLVATGSNLQLCFLCPKESCLGRVERSSLGPNERIDVKPLKEATVMLGGLVPRELSDLYVLLRSRACDSRSLRAVRALFRRELGCRTDDAGSEGAEDISELSLPGHGSIKAGFLDALSGRILELESEKTGV